MFELTGYRLDNKIKSCVNEIYVAMCNASTHAQQAIKEKYRSERFDCVSLIEPPKNLIFLTFYIIFDFSTIYVVVLLCISSCLSHSVSLSILIIYY